MSGGNTRLQLSMLAAGLVLVLCAPAVVAMELSPEDVRIEESPDGGFYLYIRALDGVQSVLVVESTEHPERAAASYALRDLDYHPANAGERRILDGDFLEEERGQSLVSSTVRPDAELGQVFRIFIPYTAVYGYPWSRSGQVSIREGTYLNLRTFELPYADYSGAFVDNPFRIRVEQLAIEEQTTPPLDVGPFLSVAVEGFEAIAELAATPIRTVALPEDLTAALRESLDDLESTNLDVILVLDTTQSMYPYMPELKEKLVPMLRELLADSDAWRVGVVFFRDHLEEYVVRQFPFTDSLDAVQGYIDRAVTRGGRDIPEAVHEGIYAALKGYDWQGDERRILLVGDAPPHPQPRGHVTEDMVFATAEELRVRIQPVLTAPY